MDYFFDDQIRRYLLQFMRIFSDIKVRNGPDSNGLYTIQRVPIMYGDPSRMVAQIIKGVSENTSMPNPMFSAYIDGIKMAPNRRQDTQYVGKISTIERRLNNSSDGYTDGPGLRQDIERYMPVPYDLYLKLDVWTSNITTKLQLFEQIAIIFNPSIQLQQNSNLLDWTSIFEVWLEDYTFSNRSIPQGAEDERDIMSFKFKVPIWINPPARVKRSGLIAEIVSNVFYSNDVGQLQASIDGEYDAFRTCINGESVQIITTEGGYRIAVSKGLITDEIRLVSSLTGEDARWDDLIQKYGQVTENITKLRIKLDPDIDSDNMDIIGNISVDPSRPDVLLFYPDIDTLPQNTLPPIMGIIDPAEVWPGHVLPSASAGQRYLLTSSNSTGEEFAIPNSVPTSPWGQSILANPNDIIEFNGTSWVTIFDSVNSVGKNYVVNIENSSQYMFDSETNTWTYTYYGIIAPGYWRIDNVIAGGS